MLHKADVITSIKTTGLVAVIRAENTEQAYRITEACIEGGAAAIEITFTVPGALAVIQYLSSKYNSGEILVGAGTVLDPETARIAILEGAQYVVSPYLNVDTVKLCNRYQIACMPGAMTVREVVECMEAGADIIKIFPGELFGAAIIKAIQTPLPQAQLMPTGGVSIDNVGEWIRAGACAVGVGGDLTGPAKSGEYSVIIDRARKYIHKINEARRKA